MEIPVDNQQVVKQSDQSDKGGESGRARMGAGISLNMLDSVRLLFVYMIEMTAMQSSRVSIDALSE